MNYSVNVTVAARQRLATLIELLEQALEIDAKFAECWTALAEAHVFTAVYTPCLDKLAGVERMAECAKKAISLSPHQGHARAMLGIYQWTQNDAVGALDLAHEAYLLEPENPCVVMRFGSFLLYCGRTKEALPYIDAAIDQVPVDGRNYGMLCAAQLNLGNVDAAMEAGQRSVDLGNPPLHWSVAAAASSDNELAADLYYSARLLMNTVIFPPAGTQPMAFKTLGQQITPPNMVGLMSIWADVEPIRQTRLHPDLMEFANRIGLLAAWEKYGWPDLLPNPATGTAA